MKSLLKLAVPDCRLRHAQGIERLFELPTPCPPIVSAKNSGKIRNCDVVDNIEEHRVWKPVR